MSNLAEQLIEPEVHMDLDPYEIIVEIRVFSRKHDCNSAFQTTLEIIEDSDYQVLSYILKPMVVELKNFIQEKSDATSEG